MAGLLVGWRLVASGTDRCGQISELGADKKDMTHPYRHIFLIFGVLQSVAAYAQHGALPVNIQAQIFDRSDASKPPVTISERFDVASGMGPRVMIPASGEAWFGGALFSNDGASNVFGTFQIPGMTDNSTNVTIPRNALYFFGSRPNNTIAASNEIFSGMVQLLVDPITPLYASFVYSSGPDNPIFWDTNQDPPGASLDGPVFSWDYINDGIVGNGDNRACDPAAGPIPDRVKQFPFGFIAVIERGGCTFATKLYNAAWAGARAAIIFNQTSQGDDLPQMFTAGASIPGVLVTSEAGKTLLTSANRNANTNVATLLEASLKPTNIYNNMSGSYTVAPDGSLGNVNLNFWLEDQSDHILVGTITGAGVPATDAASVDHAKLERPRGQSRRQVRLGTVDR